MIAVRPGVGTVARFPLPILEPDLSALIAQPATPGGKAGRGHVDCLLVAGSHVLAMTSTPAAAAITDLQTKASAPLTGYTRVVAATVGGDGIVYALAWRAAPALSLRFLRIDPHSLHVLAAWDADVTPSAEPVWALPTRFGAIFYWPGAPDSLDPWSATDLWLVDQNGARENSTVAANVGERMGPGRGDSVLFYGRPGDGVGLPPRHRRRCAEPGGRPAQRTVGRDHPAGGRLACTTRTMRRNDLCADPENNVRGAAQPPTGGSP